jgi:coenzyme F420-0:L-glutamate ligase/coenzyme F420-1:gamma-L-glutamate ligase
LTQPKELRLLALPDFPRVAGGDDLSDLTVEALKRAALDLRPRDVLVFAQKVISKAENRRIDLASITPTPRRRGPRRNSPHRSSK